jgi:glycosyltransferase involved in cell wall biosynthesis
VSKLDVVGLVKAKHLIQMRGTRAAWADWAGLPEILNMNRIATVVKGYPRLSETFIAQEILGLEKRGIPQLIVSLRQPTDGKLHDLHREIAAEVLYLPEYLQDDPRRVRIAREWAAGQPGFPIAWAAFQADLERDRTANRRRRFGQACVLARELPDDVDWLHAHFLHTPASVARYAALIRGMGWSFSAHAKDIWTTPAWELGEKLASADWGVTCTRANLDYLRSLSPTPGKLHLVYHGLDFSRFPAPPARARRADAEVTLVSVGRAVEKKGYADLVRALAQLRDEPGWRFEHAGGGPLAARLRDAAAKLGVGDRMIWHGAKERAFIFDLLSRADLFVLPSRLTRSGDRDGLPNVLMEAQAFGVPVLSTDASGIPELITHGENGWLVPQKDPRALAKAIGLLIGDPQLRQRLGQAGAASVRARFSAEPGIDLVTGLLETSRATARSRASRQRPAAGAQRARFVELLRAAEVQAKTLEFWWRDDDAETVTPALEQLFALRRRHGVPLGLAVIPKGATPALAARLATEPDVSVLQHGWQHALHNPDREKKAELGDHRPLPAILAELAAGRERLASLFGKEFLPILVPPWNRIGAVVNANRQSAGLIGISLYGGSRSAEPHSVNTHLDIFDWKGTRGPMASEQAFAMLAGEVERRLSGGSEPIGILSHHLRHEPASWDLLEDIFSIVGRHPAVAWPPLPLLFRLDAADPGGAGRVQASDETILAARRRNPETTGS